MRRISRGLIGLWLIGLLLVSHARLAVWRSDVALWSAAVQTDPLLLRPRINLAAALMTVDQSAALTQWTAAMTVIDRDEGLPQPPSRRREVAVNLAALLTVQRHAAAIAPILLWGGCDREGDAWTCPAND